MKKALLIVPVSIPFNRNQAKDNQAKELEGKV